MFFGVMLFVCEVNGQILVGNKIILTGATEAQRKVSGLTSPIEENDAVNLGYFLSGSPYFGITSMSNSDSISFSIYPTISQLSPGLMLNFISPLTNSNSLYISINGISGYYQITKKGIQSLDSADIFQGMFVSVIFDGLRFQCVSSLNKKCSIGFIKASEEYCIAQQESDSASFWVAVNNCGKKNARVCNWGEWYYACQKAAVLGLVDMTNNFEWIDGGGNSLGWTVPPTSNTGFMGGSNSCINVMAAIVDTTHTHGRAKPKTYHCCYTLK